MYQKLVVSILLIVNSFLPVYSTDDTGAPAVSKVKGHFLNLGLVKLHVPGNLSAGYVGTSNIYIYWHEPENYHLKIPLFMNISDHRIETDKTLEPVKSVWANMTYHVVTSKPEEGTSHTPDGVTVEFKQTSPPKATNLTKADWVGQELVPFDQAHLIGYILNWKENGSAGNFTTEVLPVNSTEYHLKGLKSGTTYQISVTADYVSMTTMKSNDIFVTTLEPLNKTVDTDPNCFCDSYGTTKNGKKCHRVLYSPHISVPLCTCKSGYTGLFCERCEDTHFRTHSDHPCYKCPCNTSVSSGTCDFYEDKLTCDSCKHGYAGKLCEKCADGFFRLSSHQPCKKCFCHGRSSVCERSSGFCIGCQGNTTGYSCERCVDNYIGNPAKNQPCIHKDKVKATGVHSGAVVAGVCIGLLILIGGVVGFIVYRRWKKYPSGNKFWTVELRDDHEKVNFSALPEDEMQARRMDYDFYQDQGGNRSRDGAQKYSQLQEI